jgi:hypothetical protein
VRLPRWIFAAAGVYGLITLLPLYFLERWITPAPNHPEYYYGFIGAALAFQVLFLIVARDPQRLRPAMPACILEKVTWAVALAWLWSQGRIEAPLPLFGLIDLIWAALFVVAYLKTPER